MPYSYVLTDDEKRELLRIARATLREHFYTGRIPPGKPHRDSLTAEAGVFATLRRNGKLRGCAGTQEEAKPLFRTVQEVTIAAATRDPRFDPVTEDEVDEIEIELSVLGAGKRVSRVEDVEIGVHGLTIEHQGKCGLLLPQMATESRLSTQELLEQVCLKAGLPKDAWAQPGADVQTFTAQVFNDKTHPPMRLGFL